MPFAATQMDLENILGDVSQAGKDKCHMLSLICRNKKKKLIYYTEIDQQTQKIHLWSPKWNWQGKG